MCSTANPLGLQRMLGHFLPPMDNKKNIIAVKIKTARRSSAGIGGIRMATLNKYHKGFVFLIALVFLFSIANLALAQTKVFVEEYTYQASEADSKISSRVIALEQVKRLLLEKLGTYLESKTEVKNFQLTKDQIVILTAGIVRAEIIDEKWDGKTYYLKAKLAADSKEVVNSIDKLRQDRQKTKELEVTRKKADEALREVEKLKKELEISKGGKQEQDQYNRVIDGLSAIDWSEKGYALARAGRSQEAIEAYTRAIELGPKDEVLFAGAHYNRGTVYSNLGNYGQAIRDFDKAIDLNPRVDWTYYNRGVAYTKLRNDRQAIRDFDKAIDLNPNFADAYFVRGLLHSTLGNHRQAIRDLDKAIDLNPNFAKAYFIRGSFYGNVLGNRWQAVRDYSRAIELNPNDAEAYCGRGLAYDTLGNSRQALEDLKIAAGLGSKNAQDFLRSKGISW